MSASSTLTWQDTAGEGEDALKELSCNPRTERERERKRERERERESERERERERERESQRRGGGRERERERDRDELAYEMRSSAACFSAGGSHQPLPEANLQEKHDEARISICIMLLHACNYMFCMPLYGNQEWG